MIDDSARPHGGKTPLAMARSHGIRIRRLRLHAGDASYDVDFRAGNDSPRPLSVIAGPIGVIAGPLGAGGTTILEYIDYCLGASDHLQDRSGQDRSGQDRNGQGRKVQVATLEVDLSGTPYLIQRGIGAQSTFAYVRAGRLDERGGPPAERRRLRPAGHPDSLSSMMLAHCKLEGVQLRDTPTQADSGTDPLSFRSLMWLCFLPNERLDNKNLLFEDHQLKHLKLRQVFDVVFDVHDDRSVELSRIVRELDARLAAARIAYTVAKQLVEEQRLGSRAELESALRRAHSELVVTESALADLDRLARASTRFAKELRERHREAAAEARQAAAKVRDHETQLQRLVPLRAQYAEDVTRLTMLAEAHRLFAPVRVVSCPACLTALAWPPTVNDGRCTLCHSDVPADLADPATTAAHASSAGAQTPETQLAATDNLLDLRAELRAVKTRLAELTGYLDELERALPVLRIGAELAQAAETRAVLEIDVATAHAVTPYLAQRDAFARRREAAAAAIQRGEIGLHLIEGLEGRARELTRQESATVSAREELTEATTASAHLDRSVVVRRVSDRYRDILTAWRYPMLADAYLADDLTPFVRGNSYAAASPGGRTLTSLAWQLAVFEIAWETGSSHPGFLLLDSPQKNLGQLGEHDAEFVDAIDVADIYRHLNSWLSGRGAGAQIIVADNALPAGADPDVIVRSERVDSHREENGARINAV